MYKNIFILKTRKGEVKMTLNQYNVKNKKEALMTEKEWVQKCYSEEPEADAEVIRFIGKFIFYKGIKNRHIIQELFRNGYCLYFAHMLKEAFGRGEVLYVYDDGHFIWKDDNNVKYDVLGVNHTHKMLIPEAQIGDGLMEYKHIPGRNPVLSESEIVKRMEDYIEKEA